MSGMGKPFKLGVSYAVDFSSDGALLVAVGKGVVAWDTGTRTKRFRVQVLPHSSDCSIHPAGHAIVVKNTAGRVVVLDAHDGALLRSLDAAGVHRGSNILHSRCGDYLVDGNWEGELIVRRADDGAAVFRAHFPGETVSYVTRTACGGRWAIMHQPKAPSIEEHVPPAWVSIWAWPFSAPMQRIEFAGERIEGAVIAPDGEHLCFFTLQTLSLMRLSDARLVASVPAVWLRRVVWSPDGREVACIRSEGVELRSVPALELLEQSALAYACDAVYSRDGSLLALGAWQAGVLAPRKDRAVAA